MLLTPCLLPSSHPPCCLFPSQIRLSVHQNHKAFLRVSQAIPKMEVATSELRLCVQGAEAVAQALSKARTLAMVSVRGGRRGEVD